MRRRVRRGLGDLPLREPQQARCRRDVGERRMPGGSERHANRAWRVQRANGETLQRTPLTPRPTASMKEAALFRLN